MSLRRRSLAVRRLACVWACLLATGLSSPPARGDHFLGRLGRLVKEKEYHGVEPATCSDGAIEQLAMNIDWLEHHIDTYGSVVAKQPDVWGEARLTKHRDEFERILFQELNQFEFQLNGVIRQSDQSFAAAALALSVAASAPAKAGDSINTTVEVGDPKSILPQSPTAKFDTSYDLKRFDGNDKINIEPAVYLNQLSRYVQHLHELRRINEGDDTSDSPGYALDLVRIPVSILPGKLTREGFGAEITVTATPVLTNDLLTTTFRNLVINDLVDQLSLPLLKLAEGSQKRREAKAAEKKASEQFEKLGGTKALVEVNCFHQRITGAVNSDQLLGKVLGDMLKSQHSSIRELAECYLAELDDRASIASKTTSSTAKYPKLNSYSTVRMYALSEANLASAKQAQSLIDMRQRVENLPKERQEVVTERLSSQTKEMAKVISDRAENLAQRIAEMKQKLDEANERAMSSEDAVRAQAPNAVSSRGRRSRFPLPPSQILAVFGIENLEGIADEFYSAYEGRNVRWKGDGSCKTDCRIDLLDMRRWLQEELDAAFELLVQPGRVETWYQASAPQFGLARAIRECRLADVPGGPNDEGESVATIRGRFFQGICPRNVVVDQLGIGCGQPRTTIECLAWAVAVDSALLNARLNEDVRRTAVAKQCYELQSDRDLCFFLPAPQQPGTSPGIEELVAEHLEAAEKFQQYVRCRWPIHVFAIDPCSQEQNIADYSSRRRELQLALSMGFVQGQIGANALMQHSRQLETEIETISLNQTIVGFGHGSNTFGWRFMPRVQALDQPGAAGTVWQSLRGTPRDHDLRKRQLEPGMRECVAIVMMPSFVPYVDFDVRSNWYRLTNPKNAALTMKDTVRLSRAVAAMRSSRAQCAKCAHCYRDGEVDRLMKRVEQLDAELPLQTMRQQIPFENTLGGFEMFNSGVTDFAPELYGWYGAPGIVLESDVANLYHCGCYADCQYCKDGGDKCFRASFAGENYAQTADRNKKALPLPTCEGAGTTLFLVGNHLSVHDTKVIAGGVCIPDVRLVSREIMRVTIPSCVSKVEVEGKPYVAVYAATPYGVTNHLHIPVAENPLKKAESELAKKVTDLETAVKSLATAAPGFSAGSAKIGVTANCNEQTRALEFATSVPAHVDLKFSTPYVEPCHANVVMAVKYAGQFQGAVICLTSQPVAVADEMGVRLTLGSNVASEIVQRIANAQPTITAGSFDEKKLLKASAHLFLQKPGCCQTPLRGEIPIEIKLACECCAKAAPATSGGEKPAEAVPAGPAVPTPGPTLPAPAAPAAPAATSCNCADAGTASLFIR
ncbi:MAG: hypothetical protein KF688_09655 [Pirellulales bacterium]|nr:hypothetical protein [Pirellulales bacterium]